MSFENDAVRALIHTLKYQGYPPAILYVADNLTPVLEKMVHDQPALQIVPIPSSKKRQRSRGYNQIMLVLNECARQLPSLRSHISQNALTRQKDTKPQTSLQRAERLKNMHDAFVCDARTVSGAHLLIIDDVYTTGATMHAAIEACQAAGAASVRGLVFSSKHY
jgi:ComF family protein